MAAVSGEDRRGDPTEKRKLMKKERHEKITVTVRLTDKEDQVLSRLCTLKKTKTGYLARLAKDQARRELLDYAAGEYMGGKASLSELAKKTGLDVPTIMDEVARIKGGESRAVEAFLSAVKTLSKLNKDSDFYDLAVKAVRE
jgi:predicted transcriptional regulator